MARIRTLKPEFWSNEKMATVSHAGRLLAIALLNYADDEGFFKANEKLVKAFAFPIDDSVKIPVLLRELSGIGYVELRSSNSGQSLGCVLRFVEHQYINKPRASSLREVWEASGTGTVAGTEASAQEGNGMERNGKEQGYGVHFVPPSVDVSSSQKRARYAADFEAFWMEFSPPSRRLGKLAASQTWKRLSSDDKTKAVEMLPAFKESNRGKEEGHIVIASTYLAQRRFDDFDDVKPPIDKGRENYRRQMEELAKEAREKGEPK